VNDFNLNVAASQIQETMVNTTLSAQRVIHIRRLRVHASIGVLKHEHESLQPIIFDIELTQGDAHFNPNAVLIDRVLDYRLVREIVKAESTREHVLLVEALVDRIARKLMEFSLVSVAKVAAFKTQAFDDCDEVGVEVTLTKSEWLP
jgi:7,8-dihydroneopterin aldolase/epimerase/oxygenase